MESVAPILPSRDLPSTLAFYERLGFEEVGHWPEEYLIVRRGSVGLHFFWHSGLDPWSSIAGWYLYVEDADALHAEFALVDPEGNLLGMGSPARR